MRKCYDQAIQILILRIVEQQNKIKRLQSVLHKNLSFCRMINIFLMLFNVLCLAYFALHLVKKLFLFNNYNVTNRREAKKN